MPIADQTGPGPARTGDRGLLRGLGQALVCALALLLALLLGWLAFWSLANPPVEVGPPRSLPSSGGARHARGTVLVLGDTAPGDRTGEIIEREGPGAQFAKTRELLRGYDAVVVNLESPLTSSTRPWPVPKRWVYAAEPSYALALRDAGVSAACLANNHVYDYGRRGLADTLRHLDEAKIARFGADLSEAGARAGLVIETAGGRLGLVAYAQDKPRWRLQGLVFALDTRFKAWPGVARMDYADLARDMERMRGHADVVAVLVHWGENYRPIDDDQVAIARAAVELGADLVIGHHPHMMQPIGAHLGRPIVYSLGNYAFGTIGSRVMRFGMGVAVHLEEGRLAALEIVPLATQNREVGFVPRVPGGSALDEFFGELLHGSSKLGVEVIRKVDRGWWSPENGHLQI